MKKLIRFTAKVYPNIPNRHELVQTLIFSGLSGAGYYCCKGCAIWAYGDDGDFMSTDQDKEVFFCSDCVQHLESNSE